MLELDEDHKAKVTEALEADRKADKIRRKVQASYDERNRPKAVLTQEQKDRVAARGAKYYKANKKKRDLMILANLQIPRRYKRNMLVHARARAKKEGLPCTITVKDIYWPTHCPVFGYPFSYKRVAGVMGTPERWKSPSLDKIKPELGYVPGNVQVLSYRANTMKHNSTEEELKMFADWVFESQKNSGEI